MERLELLKALSDYRLSGVLQMLPEMYSLDNKRANIDMKSRYLANEVSGLKARMVATFDDKRSRLEAEVDDVF